MKKPKVKEHRMPNDKMMKGEMMKKTKKKGGGGKKKC